MKARQRMDFWGNCAREKVNSKQMLKNDAKRMAKLREGTSETLELMVDFKGLSCHSGTGWVAVFDSRSMSVRFKAVKDRLAPHLAGLRKGDV